MTMKEYVWTLVFKTTFRGLTIDPNIDEQIYAKCGTIVKDQLQQMADTQGANLTVVGTPKISIINRDMMATPEGLYAEWYLTVSAETTYDVDEASPFVITAAIITAILALIKIAIIAYAIAVVSSSVRDTFKVFESSKTTKTTTYNPKTGQYEIIETIEKAPKIPEAPVTTTISLGMVVAAVIIVIVAIFYFRRPV